MARRNDHTKKELRNIAAKAGYELIKKSGFAGFSTRQVAKKIGYTVGTLYNIFEDYDDIILHINAITFDNMKEFIESKMNPKLENIEAIKDLAKIYIEFARKNYNCWNMLFEYNLRHKSQLPKWYQEKIEQLFQIIENILLKFIDNQSQIANHSKIIWASIHGICTLGLTNKLSAVGLNSTEFLTDSLVENYLKSCSKNKS